MQGEKHVYYTFTLYNMYSMYSMYIHTALEIRQARTKQCKGIQTRAVESDFKKYNKSQMHIIQFSDFIQFFNR